MSKDKKVSKSLKVTKLIVLIAIILAGGLFVGCKILNFGFTGKSTDNYIYYKKSNEIYKVDKNTKEKQLVIDTGIKEEGYIRRDCQVNDGLICCVYNTFVGTDGWWPHIYGVKADGTDGKIMSKGYNPVIYDNNVYYIKLDFDENYDNDDIDNYWGKTLGIYRMSLDGTDDTCILDGYVEFFIIKDSKIYFDNGATMSSVNLDGSNLSSITSSSDKMADLYTQYEYDLDSADLSNIEDITGSEFVMVPPSVSYESLDVSDGYIYLLNYKDYYSEYENHLCKINLETKEITYLKKLDGSLRNIVVEDDCVLVDYYDGYGTSRIILFDTDGENEVLLEEYEYYES